MIPSFIQDGKVDLAQPCEIPWNQMDAVEGKNRFCRQCTKVVHDITGMTREEIHTLLLSNPGNVCVNFVDLRLPKDTETKLPKTNAPRRKSGQIRYIAATAAMWVLLQQAQGAPLLKPRIEIVSNPPAGDTLASKTIVSGKVLDNNNDLVPEEMDILITCQGTEVARTKTRAGLFSIDLAGRLSPTDLIKVSVITGPAASSNVADAPKVTTSEATAILGQEPGPLSFDGWGHFIPKGWSNGSMEILLEKAQNIYVNVQYQAGGYQEPYRNGGIPPQVLGDPWFLLNPKIVFSVQQPPIPKVQDRSCTDH